MSGRIPLSVRRAAGVVAAVAVSVTALPGCTAEAAPHPYVDPDGRFSIVLPEGWVRTPELPPFGTVASFVDGGLDDPAARLAAPSIDVAVPTVAYSLAEAVSTARTWVRSDWTTTVDEPVQLVGGTSGHLLGAHSRDAGEGFRYERLHLLAAREQSVVMVSVTAADQEWDGYGTEVFVESLRSLMILDDPAAPAPAQPVVIPTPPPPSAPRGEFHRDPAGRFGLVPPAGWQPATPVGDEVARFIDPGTTLPDGPVRNPTLSVRVQVWPGDLQQLATGLAAATLEPYASSGPEYVLLADGTPAALISGEHLDWEASGQGVGFGRMVAVENGSAVVVTAVADLEVWPRYHGSGSVEAALRSLVVPA